LTVDVDRRPYRPVGRINSFSNFTVAQKSLDFTLHMLFPSVAEVMTSSPTVVFDQKVAALNGNG
jgi:hypothetical protein